MKLSEYTLRLLEATGSSFVAGGSAAMFSNVLRTKRCKCISNLVTRHAIVDIPLRNGGEFAKYAMLYSVLYYGMDRLGANKWARSLGSSFAASFLCGLRNGKMFAFRSGVGGVGNTLIYDVFSAIKNRR